MIWAILIHVKQIAAEKIIALAESLIEKANFHLPPRVTQKLQAFAETEKNGAAKSVLSDLVQNTAIATAEKLPLCQDTGTAVFFVELGHEVQLDEPLPILLERAVDSAYKKHFLRASMVDDPLLNRKNTGNNCPPIVHIKHVAGNTLTLRFLPKGGGAENKSVVKMLRPVDGREGVIQTVLDAAQVAGGASCPPWLLGIGIGGSFDSVAEIAKEALLRPLGEPNMNPQYAELEQEIATQIEALDIGALGLGGTKTVLAVHVESRPTHIASLPVAVNFQCHSARVAEGCL